MSSNSCPALVLIVAWSLGATAAGQAPRECGTVLTEEQVALALALEARGTFSPADVDERFVPRVPVTLHVVRRTNGTGGMTAAEAQAAFNQAVTYWESMRIELFQLGSVRFINDSGLFDIDDIPELYLLWLTDVVPNAVNVYFVNSLPAACGYGSYPGLGAQGVAVQFSCTTDTANTTLAHEIGHYFFLYHTHETSMGAECPSGSNCATTGDLVCDTPADPNLAGDGEMDDACMYTGTSTRCGGQPFNPDTRNIMHIGNPRTCRDRFTAGQRNRALGTLTNLRPNLIESGQPNVIWVDFNSSSLFPNGDFTEPYRTLASGLNAVSPGGQVVIKAGSSTETGVFTRAAVIDSFLGSARLGQ